MEVRKCEIDRRRGDTPYRQVHVKNSSPRDLIGQPTAQGWTKNRSCSPYGREERLVTAALGGRENVTDNRKGQGHKHAAADALQASEYDQLIHAVDPQKVEMARRATQGGRQ